MTAPTLDELRAVAAAVCDPELPPLTIDDLGILRSVEQDGSTVVVTLTPTYSGCPAVEYIEDMVRTELETAGCDRVEIVRSFNPAWTTDWISEEGRRKMVEAGIAPPGHSGGIAVSLGRRAPIVVPCPRCGSDETELLSTFGSTACKALYRCESCSEPFDHFKAI